MRCVGWEMMPRGHRDLESLSTPPVEHLFEKNCPRDLTFQPPSPLPPQPLHPAISHSSGTPWLVNQLLHSKPRGLALGRLLPSRYEPQGVALNWYNQGTNLGDNWNTMVGERVRWDRRWWFSSLGCPKHHTTTDRGLSVKSFANYNLEVGHSFSDTDKTTAHAAPTPSLPLPAR